MVHVSALAQHIFTLEPDKDAARLSFYQFLKNLCEPSETVNAELINRFYVRALAFTHWQANKVSLFKETESLLRHFQEVTAQPLMLGSLLRASDLQIIPVENLRDFELVAQKNAQQRAQTAPDGERIRILREGENRIIEIAMAQDRSLRVTTYPRALVLMKGELSPLPAGLSLSYTPNLQLTPMAIQELEVGPFASASFHLGSQGLIGNVVRGYTFQKFATIDGGALSRYPLLFYPMKRLEQFFVDRNTDPMYLDLVAALEKALELTAEPFTPEIEKFAHATLERGRLALDHIFPEDSFFRLLINNLEKSLALASTVQNQAHARRSATPSNFASRALDAEPEGADLLKEEPWPEIRNLPV